MATKKVAGVYKVPSDFTSIGDNVYFKTENGVLYIAIDTTEKGAPSASGKSLVVASTRGNVNIAGVGKLGVNLYQPK